VKNARIIIVTGLSGSGKSTVLKAFEDIGFFCVDNMPVVLLAKFLELPVESRGEILKIALVMDLREKGFLESYQEVFPELREKGYHLEILFLDASDEILVRRFSQTRRQHPLAGSDFVLKGIRKERKKLSGIKEIANQIVDTSFFSVHDLRKAIIQHYTSTITSPQMTINLLSFGYKYGLPYDADIVIDVRFLPNPYFVPGLKNLNGEEPEVIDYVMKWNETEEFIKKFQDLLRYLIPLYEKEGKSYLTIAIGCTGGRHRSVAIAEELRKLFDSKNYPITLTHRDIHLE